jgi:hypothetical protein
MNAINIITPYKYQEIWVFDDQRVGLVQEPFVSGIDTMIDRLVADVPESDDGFVLLFSASPFPTHEIHLEWLRAEGGGNWYWAPELELEGWLCPALFKYFDDAPEELYVQVKAKH